MKHLPLTTLLSAILLASCAPGPTPNPDLAKKAFELQLLHFADIDGGRDIVNNAPRFSALVKTFRDQKPGNTLVLSSGDNWIPGPEYNVAADPALASVLGAPREGRAHVAWLNALGVAATALGNHDLDLGPAEFANLLKPDGAWSGAQFPYLSTNVDFTKDAGTAGIVGTDGAPNTELKGKLAAYTTVTVGGETIGVIGATTPSLKAITSVGNLVIAPSNPEDLDALAALIQADVDALRARGVTKIVLLAHMQSITVEQALAPKLAGVDIIVAGGSNTILADANDRLRPGDTAKGTYPLRYTGKDGQPVLLVNTDGDYAYLGRLVASFDKDGVLLPSLLNTRVNGAYATDAASLAAYRVSEANALPAVKAISDGLRAALESRAGRVVGFTNVYLNGERTAVRNEETNLGNLASDAQLVYAQTRDASTSVSLKNGGGIRGSIGACTVPPGSTGGQVVCSPPQGVAGVSEAGAVSQLDLEIAFRFNNSLALVTVTGTKLRELLEHGVARAGATAGQFPQVGGLSFTFDPTLPAGSRIRSLVVEDANGAQAGTERVVVVENGQVSPEAASRAFRMVTLGFLAEGGDSYPFPAKDAMAFLDLKQTGVRTGAATFADDGSEQDALAEYFAARHATRQTAFNVADTPKAQDTRIDQTP